jgi:AcrR family transcriptional regulator
MATTTRLKNKVAPRKAGRVARKSKGKPARVRLDMGERRTQLLDLGIDLFSKHGYDDISIDSLAEEAGISKGLLYHYFGSKREYYVATVKAASLHLQRLTVPDPSLPPAARLAAAVDKHLRYVDEHRAVFVAMYRSGAAVAPEVNKIIEAHRDVVMRYFLEGIGVSTPRPMLRTSLRAWIAMVEGASLDWISHPAITRDQLRDLLVAGYVAMLAKTFEMDPETAQAITRLARPV